MTVKQPWNILQSFMQEPASDHASSAIIPIIYNRNQEHKLYIYSYTYKNTYYI